VLGRSFPGRSGPKRSPAIIRLPKGDPRFLTFTNLVEVHVLAIEHPLATEQFKTNGVDLFVERLGELINASQEGQLGMKSVLESCLDRIEYDRQGRAIRLFPVLQGPMHPGRSSSIRAGRLAAPSWSERPFLRLT
jgi:hypothetical protein